MESIYLKVTRDYTPNDKEKPLGTKDSAISVEKGDIIFDVRKDDEGWLCGKNLNSGKTGRFPSDCVAKLSDVGEKNNSGSSSSLKSAEKKEPSDAKPLNRARPSVDTKVSEPKRTTEPTTGSLRRPPNPRPFGLSSRYPRPYEKEKKESSGDSGCVEDEDDYYLNDNPPEKKKPLSSIRKPSESETKKPSAYESRFGNKTYSPVYSTRPSVSKLKSAFLDNDQRNSKGPDMKGKDKPKETIEMSKKPTGKQSLKDKNPKVALATEDDDNDGMYASAELDDQKPSDVNKNKKPDPSKPSKDNKVNIKNNPLSGDKAVGPAHSYQVPQAPPDKPPRGGCSECHEPHIYAAPDLYKEPPSSPERVSEKYDFDPSENQQKKPLMKQEDEKKTTNDESKRRSFNRMASYESISNVGPEKNSSKGRSTESIKGAVRAVKKTKARITSSDRYPRLRIIAGICLGILTGIFIFFLFFAVLLLPALLAVVSGIIIGLVFGMILGFLDRKRLLCITLLIFPSLFSTRGKIALWILIAYFIVAGPMCNLIGNINIIALSRGECYMASSAIVSGVGSNDTNGTEANPSYVRVRHPIFQKYIDTTRELQELVNNTLSHTRDEDMDPSSNKSTPRELCFDFLHGLRNNCISIAKSELGICEVVASNPAMMSGCQPLRHETFCSSLSDANISIACENADFERCEKFVQEIKEVLDKLPDEAALAAYDYGQQPTIFTPASKKCDNAISVLTMLLPLLILLVLYEAYCYHKLYLSRNRFDNQYLTNHFKTIEDTRKSSGANDGLLPLKKCEHQKYIQPTSPQFTTAEKQNMLKYLIVYLIFLAFALIFILGDYYLYYVVSNTRNKEEQQENNRNNSTNSTGPAGAVFSGLICAPLVLPLEDYYVIVLSVLLGLLLLMILIQPYVLRLRHYIASRLYRRRERKRIAYLYYRLLEERKAFFKSVIDNINTENEENYAMDHLDAVRVLAWNFQTMETIFSLVGVSLRRCMVCGRGLNRKYVYCETDTCESIYCRTCFYDLGNRCLGCMRDSNPLSRSSSFIQGSSRKRKTDVTNKGNGV